ncbi:MAG: glycosyltransferase [Pseudomonadota bacterium]
MSFTHVLLTRFNLATPGRESDLRNRSGWLGRRFELFERYCLPSVAAQTNRNFTWIVYFDKDTPGEFKIRIEDLRHKGPFIPYFTGLFPGDGWPRSVREVLGERAADWLVSTRLDNDDALGLDYVDRLHDAIEDDGGPGARAYNFTNGFVMTLDRLYAHTHRSNAFFSLIEPWDAGMGTAFAIPHMALEDSNTVRQIDGPGAWLQIVHGENVSNKVRGRRVAPAAAAGRFAPGALDALPVPSALGIGTENLILTPLRTARDWLAAQRHARRP